MKILFVTSSSINGGAQKHISDMYRSLIGLKHDVSLVAPEGWLVDELREYRDKITIIGANVPKIRQLERKLDEIHPDITNTFILSGGCFGVAAWKKRKYGKIFITVNNPVIYDGISIKGKIIYPKLYNWMGKYANAFLTKSNQVRDEVSKIVKSKKPVISIKNGIDFVVFDKDQEYGDLRKALNIPANSVVVSNVAVLDERKGQRYLIDAICDLRKECDIHLMLVGEGPNDQLLKKQIQQRDSFDYVHMLGRRGDVNCVLANSDMFVLSSLHEGLPNALMEAMAMGLPCVATGVGGVRQLIDDKVNGYIVSEKSSDALKEAIDFVLKNPGNAKESGNNALNKIKKNYSQDYVARELEEIYLTL